MTATEKAIRRRRERSARRKAKQASNVRQIKDLLLQGSDNAEIVKATGMPLRTVKDYFRRMYKQYGITSGIKRVKLAVILYREENP